MVCIILASSILRVHMILSELLSCYLLVLNAPDYCSSDNDYRILVSHLLQDRSQCVYRSNIYTRLLTLLSKSPLSLRVQQPFPCDYGYICSYPTLRPPPPHIRHSPSPPVPSLACCLIRRRALKRLTKFDHIRVSVFHFLSPILTDF